MKIKEAVCVFPLFLPLRVSVGQKGKTTFQTRVTGRSHFQILELHHDTWKQSFKKLSLSLAY